MQIPAGKFPTGIEHREREREKENTLNGQALVKAINPGQKKKKKTNPLSFPIELDLCRGGGGGGAGVNRPTDPSLMK